MTFRSCNSVIQNFFSFFCPRVRQRLCNAGAGLELRFPFPLPENQGLSSLFPSSFLVPSISVIEEMKEAEGRFVSPPFPFSPPLFPSPPFPHWAGADGLVKYKKVGHKFRVGDRKKSPSPLFLFFFFPFSPPPHKKPGLRSPTGRKEYK